MFALSVIYLIYVSDGLTELLGQRIITSYSEAVVVFYWCALSVISLIYVSDGWTELLGQRIITSFSGAAFEFLRGVALNPSHDELSCLLYLFSL